MLARRHETCTETAALALAQWTVQVIMNSPVVPIRTPKVPYPIRRNSILVKLDFEERDRVWSFWIETGLRVHCMRLSHSTGFDELLPSVVVAQMNVDDGVLDAIRNGNEDSKGLSEQYFDMLLTLASEQPSADCITYLQWRLCESIVRLRLQDQIQRQQARQGFDAA